MKTNNIIEEIHNEFDTAVDKLLSYSNHIRKSAEEIVINNIKDEEINSTLSSLGFSNAKSVRGYSSELNKKELSFKQKNELNEKATNINRFINDFVLISPGYKVILYSQVIKICEKYNLMLAPATIYKGEIPKKNQKDIISFPLNNIEKNIKHGGYELTNYFNTPLCSNGRESKFYMCAPKNEFNLKGTNIIGNEIFSNDGPPRFKLELPKPKPQDPIVLYPVLVNLLNQVGFIIVTAWGPEASDPMIVNEKNN